MPQDIDELSNNGVYLILHTESGKAYVGEACNIRTRWSQHFKALILNRHGNHYLQHAWNKYGPEAFEFKVFTKIKEYSSRYDLKKKLKSEEVRVLSLFPEHYNLTEAGEGVMIHSDESKLKNSESVKQKWQDPLYRKNLTEIFKKERGSESGRARMKRVRLEAMANPEVSLRHKIATKASWYDPEKKAAHLAGYRTPEARENRKAAAKTGWEKRHKNRENPEFMAKEQERAKKAGASIKKRYNTTEGKAALSKQAIETWSNPETKIKLSATLKSFYTDPVNREMIAQKMRESWARRKAEKAAKLAESNSAYTASSEPPTA